MSPTDIKTTKIVEKEKRSYFSLGNTFYGTTDRNSYTNKLDNFVQRFSHDLTINAKLKNDLLNHKKRFSAGLGKEARSKPTGTSGLNRYEKIKERKDDDSNEGFDN